MTLDESLRQAVKQSLHEAGLPSRDELLQLLKDAGSAPRETPTMALTIPEVAAESRVCERTVSEWIKHDGLPAAKLGRRVVVLRDSLESWLKARECTGPEE